MDFGSLNPSSHSSQSSSYFSSSYSSVNGKSQRKQKSRQSYVGPRGHAISTYEAQHGLDGTYGRIRGYKNIDGKQSNYDRVLHPNEVGRTLHSRKKPIQERSGTPNLHFN